MDAKGGCKGGGRRAGKAKWIMRKWRSDGWEVHCCVPPPPCATAPDRTAFTRHHRASLALKTSSGSPRPGPSPLIKLVPRMCYVPPRPHPRTLNKPAAFRFWSCCDSCSPPASVYHQRPATSQLNISFCRPCLILLHVPLLEAENTTASAQNSPELSPRRSSSGSAAGPSRYSAGWRTVSGQLKRWRKLE